MEADMIVEEASSLLVGTQLAVPLGVLLNHLPNFSGTDVFLED